MPWGFVICQETRKKPRERPAREVNNVGLKLLNALYHRLAKAKRHCWRVLVHEIISELADDVGLGARVEFKLHV